MLERQVPGTRGSARRSCCRRATRRTRRRPAGSATTTTRSAGCAARRSRTGFTHIKLKVGAQPRRRHPALRRRPRRDRARPEADGRRQPGLERAAGHRLDGQLAPFDLLWIEEPTSPDDILGHAAIAPRRRADRGRQRRARPEPRDVQAVAAGRRHRRSARSTPAAWRASTRSWRSCCWRRSSASRSVRMPAGSGCASSSSTSRRSTTSR